MFASRAAVLACIALQGCSGASSCRTGTAEGPRSEASPTGSSRAAEPGVLPVKLPAGLAARSVGPELSGIVWVESLQRYVVVSDDTGRSEEGTNHAPWAFGLSADGTLDEAPIPIVGIQELNDPESACQGPGGAFFITTSHSANKKGKTPASRRMLLLVEPSQRQLRVLGSVDLTTVRGPHGGLLALAGLDPSGALDIEAITWRPDELLIGLKAPLAPSGEAVILHMADPATAVRAGAIPEGAVTLWRRVPLCVEANAARVCEGISDMTFLADGSLVLTANSPKGAESDGGGALWTIPASPADAAPRLVRRFPGLKPEGLSLSPDRASLVLVFDRDRQQPVWMRWPLPL